MGLVAYKFFTELFPLFDVAKFDQIGDSNSYQVKTSSGLNFIFTFKSIMSWRFETPKMYATQLEKENNE